MWAGNQRVPGMWVPDCHDDIPFMVDVNVQMKAEPAPDGANFYGEIGTNAFNPALVGKRIKDLNWDMLMALIGRAGSRGEEADRQIPRCTSPDSMERCPIDASPSGREPANDAASTPHQHLATDGLFGEVQR